MPVDNLVLFVAEHRRVRQSDGMQRRQDGLGWVVYEVFGRWNRVLYLAKPSTSRYDLDHT